MIRGTDARTVTDIPTGKQLHIIAFQIFSLFLMRDPVGVMEGWSVAKYQIPIPNDQNSFGICDLLFGIFSQHWPFACVPCRPNGDCGYR